MPVSSSTFFGSAGSLVISGTADTAAIFNTDGELEGSDVVSRAELETLEGSDTSTTIQAQLNAITTLADGKILVGDATNTAAEVTMSGDVTHDNTGLSAITANVIVDADVNTAAAITRSKLATGTANAVVVNSGAGVMTDATNVTEAELDYLDNAVAPTNVVLADNQVSATNIFTYDAATYDYVVIDFGMDRGAGNRETGTLQVASDGTSVQLGQDSTELGTMGVTLSANVSGANVEIQYTSTSTGTAPNFKYQLTRWGN